MPLGIALEQLQSGSIAGAGRAGCGYIGGSLVCGPGQLVVFSGGHDSGSGILEPVLFSLNTDGGGGCDGGCGPLHAFSMALYNWTAIGLLVHSISFSLLAPRLS